MTEETARLSEEMIDAGVAVLADFDPDSDNARDVVVAIFRAMLGTLETEAVPGTGRASIRFGDGQVTCCEVPPGHTLRVRHRPPGQHSDVLLVDRFGYVVKASRFPAPVVCSFP